MQQAEAGRDAHVGSQVNGRGGAGAQLMRRLLWCLCHFALCILHVS
jgi:hypothetical protein